MRSVCIKQIGICFAAFASFGLTAPAQSQEVARVVSLTPNVRQVEIPKQVCTFDAFKNQTCTNQVVTQNINDGFNVVYEYQGRLFTTFSATDPGPFIQLTSAQPGFIAPPTTFVQPGTVYSSGYAPGYAQSAFPVPHPQIIVRPQFVGPQFVSPHIGRPFSQVHGYAPRPVIVIRGGQHHGGHYSGHYGGHNGGYRDFSNGHHGGRGHYR